MCETQTRGDAVSKQNRGKRSRKIREPSDADYQEVFHINAPFEDVLSKVMRTPKGAIKTPLVEDDESVSGSSN